MDRVLLDTDIFSEIFKQRDPNVAAHAIAYQAARGAFTISVITAMEITSGLHWIQAKKQITRFETMLVGCEVLPFDLSAALLAGRIDAELKRRGTTINLNALYTTFEREPAVLAFAPRRMRARRNAKPFAS